MKINIQKGNYIKVCVYVYTDDGIYLWVQSLEWDAMLPSEYIPPPIMPCKSKRQYLLTLQVSRFCLLALQIGIYLWHGVLV